MRLATWNVNSIRSRAERVGAWLDRSDADVLMLQELKCRDDQFPMEVFASRGYEVAHHGLNQWNGVAIASRVGLRDVSIGFENAPGFGEQSAIEARAISAVCDGTKVYSLYVPNGRELGHPHYDYKLMWLEALRQDVAAQLAADPALSLALGGDFNVAPQDDDVWDMKFWAGQTHVSEPERRAFRGLLEAGLTDVVRPFAPGPGVYTFWDYQQLRFPKKQGMRIDFILASGSLAARSTAAGIDREERKGKGASDHAPVIADFA